MLCYSALASISKQQYIRAIRIIVVSFIINIVIAWSLALFHPLRAEFDYISFRCSGNEEGILKRINNDNILYCHYVYRIGWTSVETYIEQQHFNPNDNEKFIIIPSWINPDNNADILKNVGLGCFLEQDAYGFPLPTMRGSYILKFDFEQRSMADGVIIHVPWYRYGVQHRVFPLRPIMLNMSINMLFYIIFIYGTYVAYQFVRGRKRKSSGQCIHCGYDLRGCTGQICSECGWNKETK